MGKWIVTLDVTVEAINREDALDRISSLLGPLEEVKSFCLYDAYESEEQS